MTVKHSLNGCQLSHSVEKICTDEYHHLYWDTVIYHCRRQVYFAVIAVVE